MNAPVSVLLTVAAAGGCAVAALAQLNPVRQWWRALVSERFFALTITPIWALLFWPTAHEEAYRSGETLGALRIARVVCFALLFAMCGARLALRRGRLPTTGALGWYAAYAFVCFVSATYSPSPTETLWKSFELAVVLLAAVHWHARALSDPGAGRRMLDGMMFLLVCVIVPALVGVVAYPEVAYRLEAEGRVISTASAAGIIPGVNANTLGQLSGTMLVVAITLLGRGEYRVGAGLVAFASAATLFAAHSRTSLFAVVLALTAIEAVRRNKGRMILLAPALAIAVFLFADRAAEFFARGQDVTALRSMTGRVELWAVAAASISEDPLLGKGFYAGHKKLDVSHVLGSDFSSLDNTFIEALVDVGLVGTVLLAMFTLAIAWRALRNLVFSQRGPAAARDWQPSAMMAIVLFILIRAMTGPTVQVLHVNLTMMLAVSAALVGRARAATPPVAGLSTPAAVFAAPR